MMFYFADTTMREKDKHRHEWVLLRIKAESDQRYVTVWKCQLCDLITTLHSKGEEDEKA